MFLVTCLVGFLLAGKTNDSPSTFHFKRLGFEVKDLIKASTACLVLRGNGLPLSF